MRKILLLILLLPVLASAQKRAKWIPGTTPNDSVIVPSGVLVNHLGQPFTTVSDLPDTAVMLAPYMAAINERVRYIDTPGMLAPYLRAIDTTGKWIASGWLAGLMKYPDTANLVAPYLRKSDTTGMLANYLAHLNNSSNPHNVTKGQVGLGNVPNVDATDASNISTGTLSDGRLSGNVTLQGNSFNGINQLVKTGADGKLVAGVIPALALVETQVFSDQASMLAWSAAEMGDVAVRTDINTSFILQQAPASTLSNWVQLLTPDNEQDPIFTASAAYSITNTHITNWDAAFYWGDHSAAGYLLSSTAATTYEPIFSKNTAFNKDFGISAGTVAEGNDSRILNGQTAYSWGNHASVGYLTSYTETDPVFGAHVASSILSSNIFNWNTAYGWGDHALAGYLTSYTETDPVFGAHVAATILSSNIFNWNTAYGWGDHAGLYTLRGPLIGTDMDQLYYAGVYSGYTQINAFSGGDIGFINIPTWNGNGPSARYNLQIGAEIGSNQIAFRTTDINGAGTWYNVWSTANFTTTDISEWETAYSWGNHAGKYHSLLSTATATSEVVALDFNTITANTSLYASTGSSNVPDNGHVSSYGLAGGQWSYQTWMAAGGNDFRFRTQTNGVWGNWLRVWSNHDFSFTDVSNWNAAYSNNHAHANKALLDTYTQNETDIADAVSKRHSHSNQSILDAITASYTTAEQTKLSGIAAGAEVNVNADWSAVSGDAQILNKPTALSAFTNDVGFLTSYTETDPVYSASDASGITSTLISQWSTAYGWGNHATAGYLTSFTESDPIFSAHDASTVTGTLIGQWNTAYSWGNHASAGYLTSFTEVDPLSLHLTGGTVSGSVHVTGVSSAGTFFSYHGGTSSGGNWGYTLGDNTYQYFVIGLQGDLAGSNAGSDFTIWRYSDGGSFLGTALQINRSTGVANFEAIPTIGGANVWYSGNDGSGSALDADLLDGLHSSQFHTLTATGAGYAQIVSIDFNSITTNTSLYSNTGSTNSPGNGHLSSYGVNSSYSYQTWVDAVTEDNFQYRINNGGSWGTWYRVASRAWTSTNFAPATGSGSYTAKGQLVSVDVNQLYEAGVYSAYNATNAFYTGDIGFINIPTWIGNSSSNRYNLQIGAQLGSGELRFRTTDAAGAGAWRRVWSDADFVSGHIANWHTAYSWGDHSAAGYATQSWVTSQGYTTNTGTVTSVAMTLPTGLTVSGSPITGAGTFAVALQSGYSIPTTAEQTQWGTAYTYSQVGHLPLGGGTLSGLVNTNQLRPNVHNTYDIGTSAAQYRRIYGGEIYQNGDPVLTANQNITLSGDVTGSGSTAITTTIANNAVATGKIANNAVTHAKYQQIGNNRVLGNVSGSTANVAALTANDVRTLVSLDGGLYSPSYTPVGNLTNITALADVKWSRNGDKVIVHGTVEVEFTNDGASTWTLDLPVSSNFANIYDAAGLGVSENNIATSIRVSAVPGVPEVRFDCDGLMGATTVITFSFMYDIL